MKMKICKVCSESKDVSLFPKWKKTCKSCTYEYNRKWKNNNSKVTESICIDCNLPYQTIIYSTVVPNIRCRKCSINSKKVVLNSKVCNKCNIDKSINSFYKNYKICKPCLFAKRNERFNFRIKTDISFRIRHGIKNNIRRHLSLINSKKCGHRTIDILGCSIIDLKIYLESKFEPWMTWENYGLYNGELNYGWDIDHIIPISSAKSHDDIIKLNHYTNFQPLCSYINRNIKKDNITYEVKT